MDQTEELQNKIAELEARAVKAEQELKQLRMTQYLELRGQTSAILATFILLGVGVFLAFANYYDLIK